MTQITDKGEMPKSYDPSLVEHRIYNFWLEAGYFTPTINRSKKPFVMIMPPPNVTGELHMGHALTTALEDLMVRWHRMNDEPTLYLPGTDHAGIATQVVVERLLSKDGLTRHDLGREQFISRVWDWVEKSGGTILEQLKRLGASCDWTRRSFTLDDTPSLAVRTTFVNLFKKGLIFRGERITNWCFRCRTALSDLEVKYREVDGFLYHIQYALSDDSGNLTIATARPETLLGDSAVAVNPTDERYIELINKQVTIPIIGRVVSIISDEAVDPEFGTGVLKVTPGHDPVDFEIGQRNQLDMINIMNTDGTMNSNAAQFEGISQADARNKIVQHLDDNGLLVNTTPYQHQVGHCDRCDEVVDPIISMQWYVKTKPLAKRAREAVADGRIELIPARFTKVYFDWMDNIRDWCISRQLWWGHRIPVWYCDECGEIIVEYVDPSCCPKCASNSIKQDPDVLDTWFSSGLWTHSTLGWPSSTEDVDYFYPGSVMETGYDILFFWVARMIMLGMENMDDIPFRKVYLHGLVLDPEGIKMSKSKGNVLDPIKLVNIYGADALRFALTTGTSSGNNMRLNEQKLEASRNFANKLWNASRFVITNLATKDTQCAWEAPDEPSHRHDKWILSRLNKTTSQVSHHMENYQFGEAQRTIHDFLWSEYCDWYIEMSKIRISSGDLSPLPVLGYVLEQILRLLHPFMPFVTEEIWQTLLQHMPRHERLPNALIVAPYPQAKSILDDQISEQEFGVIIELVRAVRNLRAEFRIEPRQRLNIIINTPGMDHIIDSEASTIKALAQVNEIQASGEQENLDVAENVTVVTTIGTVTIPLQGLVEVSKERERLANELSDLEANQDRLSERLVDKQFLEKAPQEVVDRERQRLDVIKDRRKRISEVLSRLST